MGEQRELEDAWFVVERLDVFWATVDLLRLCDRAGTRLWRRNGSLARQLQRAVASILANIGEGAASRTGGDRGRYFDYAYRSAGEAAALIISFQALGTLEGDEYRDARQLLHRIQIMLIRMMQLNRKAQSQTRRDSR